MVWLLVDESGGVGNLGRRYDLYIHVFQGANVVGPMSFCAPDTFIEVDLNGRLAKNITYDQDVTPETRRTRMVQSQQRGSVGTGDHGGSDDDGGGGGGGDDDEDADVLLDDDGDETLYRTTIRQAEVRHVVLARVRASVFLCVSDSALTIYAEAQRMAAFVPFPKDNLARCG